MTSPIRKTGRALRDFHAKMREGSTEFLHLEVSGSLVLLVATIAALVLANSAWHEVFIEFWHTELGIFFGTFEFQQSALHWIDDGLMALFFFVVGLEIKREILVGELSTLRKASLPILAAVGGMLGPAIIYALINRGGEGAGGWGIPMATDIAFALGVLALLGSRIPTSLKIFLSVMAIADDIGAILVIAIFYTSQILWNWLLVGLALLLVLMLLNVMRVESPLPYVIGATAIWFCFFNSGVHATIAGVLIAFTIPVHSRMQPMAFVEWARRKIEEIAGKDVPGEHVLQTPDQQHCAQEIQEQARWIQAPLQRMEHALLPLSTFVILPLFALANAGVVLVGLDLSELILEPVTLGVFFGLVLGKQLGITGAVWLAVKFKLAELPKGVTWRHIYGAGWLGGIGFTMSLFISGLAFRAGVLQAEAKLAILVTSVVAGIGGYLILRGARPVAPALLDANLTGELDPSEAAA
ncbi:MAG: Na+/H+ antiporter NhaA [Coriobacteriia bacterium]|nr:Na+/H+ antiporter NhaA [Coriobacteriia bacterium]